MKAIYLVQLLSTLCIAANGYTLMNTCMPTDYKGVILRTEVLSMTLAMDYESGPGRTKYLVGGHSRHTTREEIVSGGGSRQYSETSTVEGFMYTFVQSGKECEI